MYSRKYSSNISAVKIEGNRVPLLGEGWMLFISHFTLLPGFLENRSIYVYCRRFVCGHNSVQMGTQFHLFPTVYLTISIPQFCIGLSDGTISQYLNELQGCGATPLSPALKWLEHRSEETGDKQRYPSIIASPILARFEPTTSKMWHTGQLTVQSRRIYLHNKPISLQRWLFRVLSFH
jgi:hypothetical protein